MVSLSIHIGIIVTLTPTVLMVHSSRVNVYVPLRYFASYWPNLCAQSKHPIQCWFMNFEEDDSFEPGVLESLGLDRAGSSTRRDRHLWLRFKHIERVLPEILSVNVSACHQSVGSVEVVGIAIDRLH